MNNVKDLKSIIPVCSLYWVLLTIFDRRAAPCNNKIRDGEPKTFDALIHQYGRALATVQERMVMASILVFLCSRWYFNSQRDAFCKQLPSHWGEGKGRDGNATKLLLNGALPRRMELQYNKWRVLGRIITCSPVIFLIEMAQVYHTYRPQRDNVDNHPGIASGRLVRWRL